MYIKRRKLSLNDIMRIVKEFTRESVFLRFERSDLEKNKPRYDMNELPWFKNK